MTKENSNSIPENEEDVENINRSTEENACTSTSSTSKIPSKFESSANNNYKNSIKDKHNFAPSSPSKQIKSASIADKAAIFETPSPSKASKDPALLSLSERKALFEKNKGDVLVPKAPFGMAPPVKVESIMKAPKTKIFSESNSITMKPNNDKLCKPPNEKSEVNNTSQLNKNNVDSLIFNKPIKKKVETAKTMKETIIPKSIPQMPPDRDSAATARVQQSGGIASRVAALLKNKSTISEAQIENNIKLQRQKEMDMLLNRFNKNKEVIITLNY